VTENGNGDRSPFRPPAEIDTTVAHAARIYDYMLGGSANFEVDREAAQHLNEAFPGGIEEGRAQIRANRDFLVRAVRYMGGVAGVRQFLDVGTGVPNDDNVQAVAQQVVPDARVVCVDNDPVVLAHAHQLLRNGPGIRFVEADMRDPDEILARAGETLDLTRPVGLTLVAVLHALTDADDPYGIVGRLVGAVPSGSFLAISHITGDVNPEEAEEATRRINERSAETYTLRSRDEIARFFDGLELLDPGVVTVDRWHGQPTLGRDIPIYGAVGRKP
jgi:trans-aconitate methyltransferase